MDRNMMLTPDEYLALRRIITSERESEGASISQRQKTPPKRKRNPKLSRALKQANARSKKKNGSYKKGWNRSKTMKLAHKLKKAMK